MKIPQFISDYSAVVNNDLARNELKELAKEYHHKLKVLNNSLAETSPTSTKTTDKKSLQSALVATYLLKARNIAKNSIDDKAAFEEIVWKHKSLYSERIPGPTAGKKLKHHRHP